MQSSRGFTLIELMITVAILAILLGIGVPSFVDFIRNNRASTQANELATALNLARSEAVKRGLPVTLRSPVAPNWTEYCVYEGQNADLGTEPGLLTCDDTDVLRAITVSDDFLVTSASTGITFGRLGEQLWPAPAMPAQFSITLAPKSGCTTGRPHQRNVTVALGGRVNVQRVDCP
jgi:type IV fimbrial biogenesis protein FimT